MRAQALRDMWACYDNKTRGFGSLRQTPRGSPSLAPGATCSTKKHPLIFRRAMPSTPVGGSGGGSFECGDSDGAFAAGFAEAMALLRVTVNSLPLGQNERCLRTRRPLTHERYASGLSRRHLRASMVGAPDRTRAASSLASFTTRLASRRDNPNSNRMSSSASERDGARRVMQALPSTRRAECTDGAAREGRSVGDECFTVEHSVVCSRTSLVVSQ